MAETFTCEALAGSCEKLDDLFSIDDYNEQWKDDATWILTASFVILTMQSGFGLLEIGASSAGNEVNTMLKNVADILFGALAFYFVGYGIAYGRSSNSFMGLQDFVIDGDDDPVEAGILYSRYLFQLSFAATSATIVSGCIAMRMRFEVYCVFAFYAVVVYSFVAHWVWSPTGWLNTLGFHDFAGGSAVHLHGAVNGFIAILFVGPRRGRFDGSRPESDFEESSPTSMLFGLFMLWWGWIGFNCGSTFGITDNKWIVAARAGVSTLNTAAAGGFVAMFYSRYRSGGKYIHPSDVVNGILGALVASSPTCATVHSRDSLFIGAIGCLFTNFINERVMKKWLRLDDPVGAIGVHLGGGLWGCIAVGLFADAKLHGAGIDVSGLFRSGSFELLGRQLIGIAAVSGWSLVTMPPFFYFIGILISRNWRDPRTGLRHEYIQMDRNLHGCTEDPTDKIQEEITKALKILERHSERLVRTSRISHSGIITGIAENCGSFRNNLSLTNNLTIADRVEENDASQDSTKTSSEEDGDTGMMVKKLSEVDEEEEDI